MSITEKHNRLKNKHNLSRPNDDIGMFTNIVTATHTIMSSFHLSIITSCRDNLLPGSSVAAADLCGEHCRERPRLLKAASTTAGPGVSGRQFITTLSQYNDYSSLLLHRYSKTN